MWYIKKICFAMIIMLVCVPFLYSQEQKVIKIPLPKNPRQEDIVSPDLACRIASTFAQTRFGAGVVGKPIIGYDLNGNVRAYIVPYRIGKSIFPSETEILSNLNNARNLLRETRKQLAIVRESSLESKQAEIRFEKRGEKMFLKKNTEWEQAERNLREAEKRCFGSDEYKTIVISARKDLFPIPEYSNSLPYYYTYREIVEKMAKQELGENIILSRFYYGGDLDQIFEFKSTSGNKIWVAIFPPRVVKPGEITPREILLTEEQREEIRKKWAEVMKEVQNEK